MYTVVKSSINPMQINRLILYLSLWELIDKGIANSSITQIFMQVKERIHELNYLKRFRKQPAPRLAISVL